MGILIFLLGGLVAGLILLGIAARIVQAVGLLALLMLGAACIGIVYVSLAVAGVTFAVSYEMLGSRSLGWPAAIAGFAGLSVGWAMSGAVLREVKGAPGRIRRWLGKGEPDEKEARNSTGLVGHGTDV